MLPRADGSASAAPSVVVGCLGIVGLGTQVKQRVKIDISVAMAFLALATLTACSDDEAADTPRATPQRAEEAAPPPYEVIDLGEAGSIAGNVRWVGPRPEPVMLPVRAHQDVCGDQQPSHALRIGPRGGVADTVVWLTSVRRGAALEPSEQPQVITIEGCRYQPHVLAVGVGAAITFRNTDPLLHNVHALRDGETVWDFGLPTEGSSASRTVESPGVVRVLSDVHSFMQAWVHAFDDPYFAVTDMEGHFLIPDVPAGQYVMRVWHQGWRVVGTEAGRPVYSRPIVLSRTLSVAIRKETTVDFELSARSAEIAGE